MARTSTTTTTCQAIRVCCQSIKQFEQLTIQGSIPRRDHQLPHVAERVTRTEEGVRGCQQRRIGRSLGLNVSLGLRHARKTLISGSISLYRQIPLHHPRSSSTSTLVPTSPFPSTTLPRDGLVCNKPCGMGIRSLRPGCGWPHT